MSLVMALTWFLLAAVLGSVAFFTAGLIASVVADDLSEKIGSWYVGMAQASIKDAALVVGETGGLSIVSPSWEPQFSADMAVLDGEAGHWQDPLAAKTSLAGKPFGLAPEGWAAYVTPNLAAIGKEGKRALENGTLGPQDDGAAVLDYSISGTPEVLDLRHSAKALMGSCRRRYSIVAEKWGQISQEKFHQKISTKQTIIIIGAFAVGVGLAFAIFKWGPAGGGGSGGGTTVSFPATVLGVLFV